MSLTASAKDPVTVYLFPGEGSDERIFAKLQFDSAYKVVHVVLPVPGKDDDMESYARIVSTQVDTNGRYIFVGVSFGGMICCELAEYLHPEKIIIISSAKCNKELPRRYTFQRTIPINKLVPQTWIKRGAQILQPIVEPDRNLHEDVFKSMLADKSPEYYKRTVDMILNWKRQTPNNSVIHIHGSNDHTLPIRNVKADHVIEGGSHMMTLTRGEEINALIQSILAGQKQ